MRAESRTLLRRLAALAVTLTFALSPVAQAQSPAPSPVTQAESPAPDLFCGLLTTDEVAGALGFAITVGSGTEFDCTWLADATAGITGLLYVGVRTGTVVDDIKPGSPGGTDLTIGEDVAYYLTDSLWVEVSGRMLEFQDVFTPGVADPEAALTALAAIAVARFDSLSIPEQTAPSPEPSSVGDVELKSLFPADLLGPSDQPLNVVTTIGPKALRALFRGNANATKSFEQLVAALAPQGKTIDDVSIGHADLSDLFTGLNALRVRGADASALLPQAVPLFVAYWGLPKLKKGLPAHVGGKDVTMLTLAKKSPIGQVYVYVYAHDDVVWLIVGFGDGKDAVSKEALQKLP